MQSKQRGHTSKQLSNATGKKAAACAADVPLTRGHMLMHAIAAIPVWRVCCKTVCVCQWV